MASNAENVSIWWRHHVGMILTAHFIATFHGCFIHQSHKFRKSPVPYPTRYHSEQRCAHFCSEWCIVEYGTGPLWGIVRLLYYVYCFCLVVCCYDLETVHFIHIFHGYFISTWGFINLNQWWSIVNLIQRDTSRWSFRDAKNVYL